MEEVVRAWGGSSSFHPVPDHILGPGRAMGMGAREPGSLKTGRRRLGMEIPALFAATLAAEYICKSRCNQDGSKIPSHHLVLFNWMHAPGRRRSNHHPHSHLPSPQHSTFLIGTIERCRLFCAPADELYVLLMCLPAYPSSSN